MTEGETAETADPKSPSAPGAAQGKSELPNAESHRRCTKCGQARPLADFRPSKRRPLGEVWWCRACRRAYGHRYRLAHLEKARETARRDIRLYRARHRAALQRPEIRRKQEARIAVFWAVRGGFLERPERCPRCGDRPPRHRLHAHHPDYSKPLEVLWLCSACHGAEHRKARERAPPPSA